MGYECFNNRDNGRWAHPEFAATYEEVAAMGGFDTIMLNEALPLEERKAYIEEYKAAWQTVFPPEVADRVIEVEAPGCVEEPDAPLVKMTIVMPQNPTKKKYPCIVAIPGGGHVMCIMENLVALSDTYNCVAVHFDYRTVYEGGGYPGTINDCHAAYQYLLDHAAGLKVNPKKILLYGDSAGGHLVVALAHRLKKYGIKPCGCQAFVPTVDNRTDWPSSHITSAAVGSKQLYLISKFYLKGELNDNAIPAEAYPNHATVEECVGLPATFLHCNANDPSCDSTLEYASKLNEAGVYVGLHMWHGSNHDGLYTSLAFNKGNTEDYPYTNAYAQVIETEIRDCFAYDLGRDWAAEEAAAEAAERASKLGK